MLEMGPAGAADVTQESRSFMGSVSYRMKNETRHVAQRVAPIGLDPRITFINKG